MFPHELERLKPNIACHSSTLVQSQIHIHITLMILSFYAYKSCNWTLNMTIHHNLIVNFPVKIILESSSFIYIQFQSRYLFFGVDVNFICQYQSTIGANFIYTNLHSVHIVLNCKYCELFDLIY